MEHGKNKQLHTQPILDVYLAKLPKDKPLTPLFPKERDDEVKNTKNETLQREKYFAWKLLAYAVKNTFNKDLPPSLSKNENGKWTADEFDFSLSHSGGVVCVALSTDPVGVDVQKVTLPKTETTAFKIFSEEEKAEYAALPLDKQAEYFTRKWTERESVFKSLDLPAFFPALPTLFKGKAVTKTILIGAKPYALSVSGVHLETLRLYENCKL